MRRRSDAIAAALALATVIACGCAADDDRMDAVYPGPAASVGNDAPDDDAGDDEGDDGEATEESGGTGGVDDGGPVGSDGASPPSDDAGMQEDDAGMPADDGAASGDDGMPPAEDGGGDPAQTCLDQAVTECEICACNSCLTQLQACQQDPGCVAIRMCAQANMCTGIGCLEPCGDVIDMYGGPFGPSAGLASDLSDCVEPSCPTC